jgi:hypothetical protein
MASRGVPTSTRPSRSIALTSRSFAFPALWIVLPLAGCNLLNKPDDTGQEPTTPPTGSLTARIEPASPISTDDLSVVVEGGSGSFGYAWSVNGSPRADLADSTISADLTTRDETWSVVVTDVESGATGTAFATILNSAPVLSAVTFEPNPVGSADDLQAVPDGSDPDGDFLSYTYAWAVDGVPYSGAGSVIPAEVIERGQVWSVSVYGSDGEYTTSTVTAEIEVTNALPEVLSVTVEPTVADTNAVLVATAEGSDPDGDIVTLTYDWFVDGVSVQRGELTSLDGSFFVRGSSVHVDVIPNDGLEEGPAASSTPIVITNAPPSVGTAAIEPSVVSALVEASCVWAGFDDADGDADLSEVRWLVDGVEIGAGPTVSTGYYRGDSLVCEVTPFDGTDYGAPIETSVVVLNTAPSVASVSIDPLPASATTDLTCSWAGYFDIDSDPDRSTVVWTADGVEVGTAAVLPAGTVEGGQTLVCTVTPYDGITRGAAVSASVVVDDTAPSITSVTITPDPASADDTLRCAYAGYSDPDGDPDASIIEWFVDGTLATTGVFFPSATAVRDQTVTCTVTPFDGSSTGAPMSDSVVLENALPSIASVTLSPDPAFVDDDLECTYTGFLDRDGDPDLSVRTWTVNGVPVAAGVDLESGLFEKGDVVTCELVPHDGLQDGDARSDTLTISNSLPTLTSVDISPASPRVGDTITCAASGFADADDDPDNTTISWRINGVSSGTGATLTAPFGDGDVIICTGTPNDGSENGTALTDVVTVSNTAPSITSVTITPDPADTSDTLTCAWTGFSDPDGDPDRSTVRWTVNGAAAGSTPTLAAGVADKGDSVVCTVTPSDGTTSGTPLSDSLVLLNAEPSFTAAEISPDPAFVTSPLTCAGVGFSDPDGDPNRSTYAWTKGIALVGGTSSLPAGTAVKGETLTCTATPNDGTTAGVARVDSVTISNSVPTLTSASIAPAVAVAGTPLTCSGVGFADADGDPNNTTFQWRVNGAVAGTGATLSSGFNGADVVQCTATPNDGTASGTAVSTTITIGNTAPSITSVSITPASPTTASALTCSYAGYSDVDGDADRSRYAWTINGVPSGSTSTLAAGLADRGDTVVCTVTPNDGTASGTARSATVVIGNATPSVATVSVTPEPAFVTTGLSCGYTGFSDADGDADVSTRNWTLGAASVGTGATLAAGVVRKNQTVTCTVTPNDGITAGTPVADTLTVQNSVPTITSVAITPNPATGNDALTCTAVGFADADGDPNNTTYQWRVGGTVVGSGATLSPGSYSVGDSVQCTATPNDGQSSGTARSATIVIQNAPPVITSVTLTPATLTTDSTATATVIASDVDGDAVSVSYAWKVNSVPLAVTTSTLSGVLYFQAFDTVEVTATASDGSLTGAPVSASKTVSNSAPPAPSVTFSDTTPVAQETDIRCIVTTVASDADGHAVTYSLRWTKNGANYTGALSSAVLTDDTFPAASHAIGDVIGCSATPNDGFANGTAGSANVTSLRQYKGWTGSSLALSGASRTLTGASKSVAAGADIDGDGTPDFVFAEPVDNAVYVMWGDTVSGLTAAPADVSTGYNKRLTTTIASVLGGDLDLADIDDDGQADVLVAAPDDTAGGSAVGSVSIVLGADLAAAPATSSVNGLREVVLRGVSFGGGLTTDDFGWSVDADGDVDGDGRPDMLVGAPGYDDGSASGGGVFVFTAAQTDGLATVLASDATYWAAGGGSDAGTMAAWAGDIDGDGWSDVLVGDPTASKVFVAYGATLGAATSFLDYDHELTGGVDLGFAALSLGDYDGDGLDDFFVSDPSDATHAAAGGAIHRVSGATLIGAVYSLPMSAVASERLYGDNASAEAGYSLAYGGDVDADGTADLLIGGPGHNGGRGATWLWLGSSLESGGGTRFVDAGFAFTGVTAGDWSGGEVSFAGDVNEDGLDDFVLLSTGTDASATTSAGLAHVLFTPHN